MARLVGRAWQDQDPNRRGMTGPVGGARRGGSGWGQGRRVGLMSDDVGRSDLSGWGGWARPGAAWPGAACRTGLKRPGAARAGEACRSGVGGSGVAKAGQVGEEWRGQAWRVMGSR